MKTPELPISRKNLFAVGVCLAGLALFYVGLIMPAMNKADALQQEIIDTRIAIEEQKVLAPVYNELAEQLKQGEEPALDVPEPRALSQAQLPDFIGRVRRAAAKANLSVQSIDPDPQSLADGTGRLLVRCNLQGKFMELRPLLVAVGNMPAVDYVDHLLLSESYGGVDARLDIWVRMQKGRDEAG
jgi:Tfp pilus assembly protein PilO